jgi:hypothetical protein
VKHILASVALATLVLLNTGCSGINASKSVSPASFFLPGLMQAKPPADPAAPAGIAPASGADPVLIAQSR